MSRRPTGFAALGGALPGKVLAGKYLLDSRVGTGGFSIVFRGTHVGIGRPVAVKIFRPQAGNDSGASLERFRYEGMASGRIVTRTSSRCSTRGSPTTAFPISRWSSSTAGRSRRSSSRTSASPFRRIASIMEQVCLGLAAAHTRRSSIAT